MRVSFTSRCERPHNDCDTAAPARPAPGTARSAPRGPGGDPNSGGSSSRPFPRPTTGPRGTRPGSGRGAAARGGGSHLRSGVWGHFLTNGALRASFRVSAKRPHSGPKVRGPESGRVGEPEGFTSNVRTSCSRGWQRPMPRRKGGLPGEAPSTSSHPRGGGGLSPSPGSPPPPARPLLGQELRCGTTSLPLGAEANEELMSRAAVAPQVQAPQPDISAGPRLGLRPLPPSGSQQPTATRGVRWLGSELSCRF